MRKLILTLCLFFALVFSSEQIILNAQCDLTPQTIEFCSGAPIDLTSFETLSGTYTYSTGYDYLYVAEWNGLGIGTVKVVDMSTNMLVTTISVGETPGDLVFNPHNELLYVSNSATDNVSVIDVNTNTVVSTISVGDSPSGIVVSPDGDFVYVANSEDFNISVIQTSNNTVVNVINLSDRPDKLEISSDGNTLYATHPYFNENELTVFDLNTNTITTIINLSGCPTAIEESPDGNLIYVTNDCTGMNSVSVINSATNTIVNNINILGEFFDFIVTPDGNFMYILDGFDYPYVQIIDLNTETLISTIFIGYDSYGVSISPDGDFVYVSYADEVKVIDTSTNTIVETISIPGANLNTATILLPFRNPIANPTVYMPSDGEQIYVSFMNSSGCMVDFDLMFSQNNSPVISIVEQAICSEEAMGYDLTTLEPIGQTGGVWTDVNNVMLATSTNVNITNGDSFTYTHTDVNSCTASDMLNFTVNASPTFTPQTVEFCYSDSVDLTSLENQTGTYEYLENSGFLYIANSSSDDVSVIDASTNMVVGTIPVGDSPRAVTVSPNGDFVYVANGGSSDNVSVIDVSTNMVVSTIPVGDSPFGIAISPDGNFVYVTHFFPENVSVIDANTNMVIATINVSFRPDGIVVSPDGNFIYVSGPAGSTNTVGVIDANTNMLVDLISVGQGPQGLAISPDGNFLYTANASANVSVVDLSTNTVINTINTGMGSAGVAVSPDGNFVYVTNFASLDVSVINTNTNSVIATIAVEAGLPGLGPQGVSVGPYGNFVYVANADAGKISVIDANTLTVVDVIDVGNGPFSFGNFYLPAKSPISNPTTYAPFDGEEICVVLTDNGCSTETIVTYSLNLCNAPCTTTMQICDDGDPCTINDTEILAADGSVCTPCSGVIDSNSCLIGCTISQPCDDGDPCTKFDVEKLAPDGSICIPCSGATDPSSCLEGCTTSQICDDGDPCTINDVETFTLLGSLCIPCSGVIDVSSCSASCTSTQACDDNNPCTINDMETIAADGSICVPCLGTLEVSSCLAGCTSIQPCNDGDPTTINDLETIASDGSICIPCAGTFDNSCLLEIPMTAGWNLISSYCIPNDLAMETIFADIAGNTVQVKDLTNTYIPAFGFNDIGNWDITSGYQVKMLTADTLVIEGTWVDPLATPINLTQGWNLISYLLPTQSGPFSIYQDINPNVIQMKNLTGTFIPAFNFNDMGDALPTQGYQVKVSANDVLIYDPANIGNP